MNRCVTIKPDERLDFKMVLVTAPDLRTARRLAQLALRERLVVGANLLSTTESHEQREGKLRRNKEVMLIAKTTHARLPALRRLIVANLPGPAPDYWVVPVSGGGQNCLTRLAQFCAQSQAS